MNLLFVSHKLCWADANSPSGYSATGGFPFQMQVISELFDRTLLLITQPDIPAPAGLLPLQGKALDVRTLPTPNGGYWHKLRLIPWIWTNIPIIWREVARADAVHIAVPGDVGSIGLVVALLQGKLLFVRHCGTFGEPVTISDHLLLWLLERIAGGKRVVLATGGSNFPPSKKNPNIHWIFSTTLTDAELRRAPSALTWSTEEPLRLITVCRLSESKNVQAIIQALPLIQQKLPTTHLDVVGDGEYRALLETLADNLGISRSVTFHGNLNHTGVLEALSRSHLFVFPTQVKEGFPKAVLEALACGLPVIATSVSVIPDLLKSGSGILLKDTNAPAIARAVLALTDNPSQLAEMSRRAQQVVQRYTLEAWGQIIGERLQSSWGQLKVGEE